MVALICGGPLHAAGRPAWAVAWVELPALSPSRLAALCQSLRGLPVHLRALEGGGMVRLEVSAAREDQLAAALDRLQRAARAAKVKFRVVAGGWSAPVWDVSGRPLGVHRSRRAAWPAPPAALLVPQQQWSPRSLPARLASAPGWSFTGRRGSLSQRAPPI